jgi:hypothetical protein
MGMRAWASAWVVALLAAVASDAPALAADLDWAPGKTWVFVVGLLEWEREDLWSPFPEAMVDRRDEQLAEFFRDQGVDDERVVYLQDAEATKVGIEYALIELLDPTDEDDLLIFYFCGHGHRDAESGATWFACYDAGDEDSSGWSVRRIFTTIENHFSGSRALLLADCCHSGALYDEARRRGPESDVAYAVITSSYAHNLSTGNWTFSDSLLAGLRGEGQVDLNGNEAVDLAEIARYCELELAFIEGQKSMFRAVSDFPRDATLAEVEVAAVARVGQRIEVFSKDRWYRAKSIDADGDQLLVHYCGWDDTYDEWVGPERVRPYRPEQFGDGDKVDVLWESDGKWYPATVVTGWYGLHHVRYDGYDDSSDEWVGPGRIRLRGK